MSSEVPPEDPICISTRGFPGQCQIEQQLVLTQSGGSSLSPDMQNREQVCSICVFQAPQMSATIASMRGSGDFGRSWQLNDSRDESICHALPMLWIAVVSDGLRLRYPGDKLPTVRAPAYSNNRPGCWLSESEGVQKSEIHTAHSCGGWGSSSAPSLRHLLRFSFVATL